MTKLLFTALTLLVVLMPAIPQAKETSPEVVSASGDSLTKEAKPEVDPRLASPRSTMATFLHAMNDIKRGKSDRLSDALASLDLNGVNKLVRKERGSELAWVLLDVLDKTRVIDLKKVPQRVSGDRWLFARYDSGEVELKKNENLEWRFSQKTIEELPAIFDELSSKKKLKTDDYGNAHLPLALRIKQRVPDSLKHSVLTLKGWQWIGILLIIVVGVVLDKLVSVSLRAWMRHWTQQTDIAAFKNLRADMLRPFGLMAMAVVWWMGLNQLGLSEHALLVLLVAVKFLASVSAVWGAYRLTDLLGAILRRKASLTEGKLDDALVPLATRSLKVFITAVGLVFIANSLNMDITSLLAGLGLGGLAFALAAKDVVQNLFGSVTVLLDRTFMVGDWVIIGDVEGTVEEIGFRSTRIRTFYNSVVTLPNSHLITASVDNMGARRYRRLSTKLGLAYETPPETIESFCEGVRELVRLHPYMRKDYYQVYFNGYADSALEILVYVFWETPDWNTELRERHRFLLDILRLANRMEVDFAYPTQTVYWKEMPDRLPRTGKDPSKENPTQTARQVAKEIVASTTGLDTKPAPVTIRQEPASK